MFHPKGGIQLRIAKIGIDQQHALPGIRQRTCEVRGCGDIALLGAVGGKKDRAGAGGCLIGIECRDDRIEDFRIRRLADRLRREID